jgi:ABC-type multidrug transport system ATPase subunit
LPYLTVFETLYFSARLRLPATMPERMVRLRVMMVLKLLGLAHVRDTVVGDAMLRGISGGEKRRVGFGVEMTAGHSCVVSDLPTNGLDSASALSLLQAMAYSCVGGFSLLFSIVQASQAIFDLVDRLILMCKGRTIFTGPPAYAEGYLLSLGFRRPPAKALPQFLEELSANPERFWQPFLTYNMDGLLSAGASEEDEEGGSGAEKVDIEAQQQKRQQQTLSVHASTIHASIGRFDPQAKATPRFQAFATLVAGWDGSEQAQLLDAMLAQQERDPNFSLADAGRNKQGHKHRHGKHSTRQSKAQKHGARRALKEQRSLQAAARGEAAQRRLLELTGHLPTAAAHSGVGPTSFVPHPPVAGGVSSTAAAAQAPTRSASPAPSKSRSPSPSPSPQPASPAPPEEAGAAPAPPPSFMVELVPFGSSAQKLNGVGAHHADGDSSKGEAEEEEEEHEPSASKCVLHLEDDDDFVGTVEREEVGHEKENEDDRVVEMSASPSPSPSVEPLPCRSVSPVTTPLAIRGPDGLPASPATGKAEPPLPHPYSSSHGYLGWVHKAWYRRFNSSPWQQFRCNFVRQVQATYRNAGLWRDIWLLAVVIGVLVGLLFWNLGVGESGVQERVALFFFILSYIAFNAVQLVPVLAQQRPVYYANLHAHYHHSFFYFITLQLVQLPIITIETILLLTPIYGISRLTGDPWASSQFWVRHKQPMTPPYQPARCD